MFAAKLPNVFFVQPAPVLACGDPFVNWVLSLPADQRPKTAAYVSMDDPFASPIADAMQAKFESGGHPDRLTGLYPPETTNSPRSSAAAPRTICGRRHAVRRRVRAGEVDVSLNFSPKFLYLSNGASSPVEFPSKVGANNVNGIFSCGDWFPTSNASGNQDFINAYTTKYGGDAFGSIQRRLRPTRSVSRSRRSPRRPGRSTTRRSSTRCTPAPGRPWRATSAGTSTACRKGPTCSWSGSTKSWSRSTLRTWPSRLPSTPSRTGAASPAGARAEEGSSCAFSCRPSSSGCWPEASTL